MEEVSISERLVLIYNAEYATDAEKLTLNPIRVAEHYEKDLVQVQVQDYDEDQELNI